MGAQSARRPRRGADRGGRGSGRPRRTGAAGRPAQRARRHRGRRRPGTRRLPVIYYRKIKAPTKLMDLKQHIRSVPDFPKAGINFYDITTLLKDPLGFQMTIDMLSTP